MPTTNEKHRRQLFWKKLPALNLQSSSSFLFFYSFEGDRTWKKFFLLVGGSTRGRERCDGCPEASPLWRRPSCSRSWRRRESCRWRRWGHRVRRWPLHHWPRPRTTPAHGRCTDGHDLCKKKLWVRKNGMDNRIVRRELIHLPSITSNKSPIKKCHEFSLNKTNSLKCHGIGH